MMSGVMSAGHGGVGIVRRVGDVEDGAMIRRWAAWAVLLCTTVGFVVMCVAAERREEAREAQQAAGRPVAPGPVHVGMGMDEREIEEAGRVPSGMCQAEDDGGWDCSRGR